MGLILSHPETSINIIATLLLKKSAAEQQNTYRKREKKKGEAAAQRSKPNSLNSYLFPPTECSAPMGLIFSHPELSIHIIATRLLRKSAAEQQNTYRKREKKKGEAAAQRSKSNCPNSYLFPPTECSAPMGLIFLIRHFLNILSQCCC